VTLRDFMRPAGAASLPKAADRAPAGMRRRAWRAPLAAKLTAALVGLVVLVLLVNGAVNTLLNYDRARYAALEVQEEKARSAAERVSQFLAEIETQLGWTTGAEWRRTQPDQQRYDFIRLLRQAPAITELSFIDGQGKEQLKVSRLEPDSVGSGKDFSQDPRFVEAVANKTWFGPVEFRRGSEPYMTIAVAHVGRQPGVTVADVNLKLVWDVITAIHVGEKGYAYVLDDRGRLIAHPDLSLVLRDTDMSQLPQVKQALQNTTPNEQNAPMMVATRVGMAEIARSLDGASVLTAYAVAPRANWIVFVQSPLSEALAPVYRSLLQTLALLGLGLFLALIVGGLLARRMVVPIRRLQRGAEQLGAGDLSQRLDIRTGDEIETLADRFNQMAARIKESYETLEAKVDARTADLNEALQQQTATADVLKVISRSVFDLQAVLDALLASAVRLSGVRGGAIVLREGEALRTRALVGREAQYHREMMGRIIPASRKSISGRVLVSGEVEVISDVRVDPDYDLPAAGSFARLGVPMLRNGEVTGVIVLVRDEPGPFSPRVIELVQTFADQAVIALENVRLFEEVQAKTRDLEESLQQQTATANVLKVISRSAFDLDTIFQTLVTTAVDLCNASSGTLCVRDGEVFRYRGLAGADASPELQTYLQEHPLTSPGPDTAAGRAILSGRIEQIADILLDDAYAVPLAAYGNPGRALLAVPLISKSRVEGAFVLTRAAPGPYSAREVEILQTFADQAVIAIENARLFDQVQARTKELAQTVDDLRGAQNRLIQSEKLASLGQLTAGIAHEIKNPLNFVNNFAALSRELIEELREIIATIKPDDKAKSEVDELMETLESNLAKVVQHGKRADSIVKNMLMHSRESSGERRMVDLNAAVEEAVNLAYHGARAERPGFNITLLKDLDPSVGEVDLYPQEFTRVLLNLISNGFYAATKRKAEGGEAAFEPTLKASTKNLGDMVEIKIRDNGTGIPQEVKAKMFNPFFTTKPAGEGTGLGLSLSYDIIVKQHGGTIDVDTTPGEFTEFTLVVPRGGVSSPNP
jgi:signal transduction histidine kinase